MTNVPTRIAQRISEGLKRFQPIVEAAKIRDVNESDTVVILTGILSEILGFDKYTEITTELSIRGTYCDLALKIDNKFYILLEAKAVGVELKEQHIKQAVDYAANKGIDWVILTNAVSWKVFKVIFSKPIQHILVADVDFLKLGHRNADNIETVYLLSKEAVLKNALDNFYSQKQATDRYIIGNLLCNESVLNALKKELRQVYPDIKVTNDEIKNVLVGEVIKREIFSGEESEEAKRKINRAQKKIERAKNIKQADAAAKETQELVQQESPVENAGDPATT